MAFSEKITVLELLLNLLKENETKLETLIEKMEIIDQTIQKDPNLSKTVKKYDSSTTQESRTMKILVVDDDKNLANSFKLILESVGYNVDTALTGIQALYRMKHCVYDFILLDLNLPDIMGDKLAEMIEEHHSYIDIVFITGHQGLKDKVDGVYSGKGTLLKPIKPDVLLETTSKRLALA
jgi:CheY-like chemotaxis protein